MNQIHNTHNKYDVSSLTKSRALYIEGVYSFRKPLYVCVWVVSRKIPFVCLFFPFSFVKETKKVKKNIHVVWKKNNFVLYI